jgi:putative ABC transport system ATP-binding protein
MQPFMDVPLIEIRSLNKRYKSGDGSALVLDDIHLRLPPASMTVVQGMSGSGKTTLLNIIGGLDRGDSGEVSVAGQRLDALDSAGLGRFRARDVGFIFQFHNLIPTLTVKENVLTGLEPLRRLTAQDHQLAMHYLDKVGLAEYAERFPARLSGGQQQRWPSPGR